MKWTCCVSQYALLQELYDAPERTRPTYTLTTASQNSTHSTVTVGELEVVSLLRDYTNKFMRIFTNSFCMLTPVSVSSHYKYWHSNVGGKQKVSITFFLLNICNPSMDSITSILVITQPTMMSLFTKEELKIHCRSTISVPL